MGKLQADRLCFEIFLRQDVKASLPTRRHSIYSQDAAASLNPQPEEVARILTAPWNLKSRAVLMTTYAAGLRRSEVARLRIHDIDSARMTITVHQGKGQKDRVVMLSPVLLETLRQYWRHCKPKEWLFPGDNSGQPISGNDVFMIFRNAVRHAGITKKVCPHGTALLLIFWRRAPISVPSRSF